MANFNLSKGWSQQLSQDDFELSSSLENEFKIDLTESQFSIVQTRKPTNMNTTQIDVRNVEFQNFVLGKQKFFFDQKQQEKVIDVFRETAEYLQVKSKLQIRNLDEWTFAGWCTVDEDWKAECDEEEGMDQNVPLAKSDRPSSSEESGSSRSKAKLKKTVGRPKKVLERDKPDSKRARSSKKVESGSDTEVAEKVKAVSKHGRSRKKTESESDTDVKDSKFLKKKKGEVKMMGQPLNETEQARCNRINQCVKIASREDEILDLMIPVVSRLTPGTGSSVDTYAVYGHELKRRCGYPEFMSNTSMAKLCRRDKGKYKEWFNAVRMTHPVEEVQKGALNKEKYSYFSNSCEGEMSKLALQFGEILDKVPQPNPITKKKFSTLESALNDYLEFFTDEESCKEFGLWTHAFGPVVMKHFIFNLKRYLVNVVDFDPASCGQKRKSRTIQSDSDSDNDMKDFKTPPRKGKSRLKPKVSENALASDSTDSFTVSSESELDDKQLSQVISTSDVTTGGGDLPQPILTRMEDEISEFSQLSQVKRLKKTFKGDLALSDSQITNVVKFTEVVKKKNPKGDVSKGEELTGAEPIITGRTVTTNKMPPAIKEEPDFDDITFIAAKPPGSFKRSEETPIKEEPSEPGSYQDESMESQDESMETESLKESPGDAVEESSHQSPEKPVDFELTDPQELAKFLEATREDKINMEKEVDHVYLKVGDHRSIPVSIEVAKLLLTGEKRGEADEPPTKTPRLEHDLHEATLEDEKSARLHTKAITQHDDPRTPGRSDGEETNADLKCDDDAGSVNPVPSLDEHAKVDNREVSKEDLPPPIGEDETAVPETPMTPKKAAGVLNDVPSSIPEDETAVPETPLTPKKAAGVQNDVPSSIPENETAVPETPLTPKRPAGVQNDDPSSIPEDKTEVPETPVTPQKATSATPQKATSVTAQKATSVTPQKATSVTPQKATSVTPQKATSVTPHKGTSVKADKLITEEQKVPRPPETDPKSSGVNIEDRIGAKSGRLVETPAGPQEGLVFGEKPSAGAEMPDLFFGKVERAPKVMNISRRTKKPVSKVDLDSHLPHCYMPSVHSKEASQSVVHSPFKSATSTPPARVREEPKVAVVSPSARSKTVATKEENPSMGTVQVVGDPQSTATGVDEELFAKIMRSTGPVQEIEHVPRRKVKKGGKKDTGGEEKSAHRKTSPKKMKTRSGGAKQTTMQLRGPKKK